MEDWKEIRLGDYVQFQNGYAFKSSDFKSDGKYKIIKIKELKDGLVKFFDDTANVDCENPGIINKYKVEKNDVLFALTGDPVSKPNPLSWVGRVSINRNDDKALLNQRTCKILKSNKIDNIFLYYYFRQWENFFSLASKATGSASQANISTSTIGDTVINLPPLPTQQKIAQILSSLDDKIELNNKINANLEQQAQALFKSWFVDFEPFGGEMPAGWKVGKLSEISEFNTDSYSTKDNWNYVNYLDTSSITNNSISEIQKIDLTSETLPSRAKRRIKKNDIVFSTVRPNQNHFGIIKSPIENMLVSTGFTVLRSIKDYISNEFIYFSLVQEANIQKLQQIAEQSTSTFPAIKPADVANLKILIPSEIDIKSFNAILESIYSIIDCNQIENKKLSSIRDILLPKLMAGELKVD